MNSLDKLIEEIEPRAYPVRGDGKAKYLTQTELATADAFLDIYQKLTTLSATHVLVDKELARKAELWDGLMKSQRIRIIGTANMEAPQGQYRHFGMEIWSHYGTPEEDALRESFVDGNKHGREILENYASSTYKAMLSSAEVEK